MSTVRRKKFKRKRRHAKVNKLIGIVLMAVLMLTTFVGCGGNNETKGFDTTMDITVASREDGSGTRGAFIELFGIEKKDADGNKIDKTTLDASITNSTSVMMTTVAGNEYAIGYISLGSLNDTVKALKIDGAEATVENIKNDSYKIARPFNIATTDKVSEVAHDFIDFILSADGQKVVEETGYIAVAEAEAYSGSKPAGKVVVAGSSSVTPVMEKLKEAYLAVNPNAEIEIQQSDSTTGVNSAIDGICDIGMASRELKDSEREKVTGTVIAMDGIAVVVNNENTAEDLTSEQVKKIFTGETTTWSEVTE
jgi:phosphate transport system substrate-binding protein